MEYTYGEEKGKLCTCQICGAQIFLKWTGESTADGGWTHIDRYEPYPEGWGLVAVPKSIMDVTVGGNVHNKYLRACPDCSARWERVIYDHFLKGTPFYMVAEETI